LSGPMAELLCISVINCFSEPGFLWPCRFVICYVITASCAACKRREASGDFPRASFLNAYCNVVLQLEKKREDSCRKIEPYSSFQRLFRGYRLDAMTEYTDVLICGGGPVGLLTGLTLVRMGISTVVIGEL
jgi:hypothetical protein